MPLRFKQQDISEEEPNQHPTTRWLYGCIEMTFQIYGWKEVLVDPALGGKWYLMAWNYEMAIIMHEDFEPYDIPWVPPMFFTLGNLNCPECEVFQKFCMSDCLWLWTSVRLWFHAFLLAVRRSLVLIVALFFLFPLSLVFLSSLLVFCGLPFLFVFLVLLWLLHFW